MSYEQGDSDSHSNRQKRSRRSNEKTFDYGPLAKSPLNHKKYKAIELTNGMKIIIISSCPYNLELDEKSIDFITGEFESVQKFNEKYLGLNFKISQENKPCNKSTPKHGEQDETKISSLGTGLEIPNKFQSQCGTNAAAISLTVAAGTFNDPEDVPGMAHYCEHCVFLGSKKYPKEGALINYMMDTNGVFNAFTEGEKTCFFVSCQLEHFEKSLDMITDMISHPNFPAETITREIQAIDSEFHIGLPQTVWRYLQMLRSLALPSHPFTKLGCGNNQTIQSLDIRNKLLKWKNEHYCSNYITLTLSAPIPLEELEEMAVRYGSVIQSSPRPEEIPADRILKYGRPFQTKEFKKMYTVATLYDYNWLFLHWDLEPKHWKNFSCNPLDYIASVLSQKGSGTLTDHLINKGWATSLMAGITDPSVCRSHFCSVFSILIELTLDGLKKKENVIEETLLYIKLLQKQGAQETYFKEIQKVQADQFHYFPPPNELTEAMDTSWSLQLLGGSQVSSHLLLLVNKLSFQFQKSEIEQCINELSPQSVNIMIFSKSFKDRLGLIEPFYRTNYRKIFIPKDLIERTKTLSPPKSFKLPDHNPFISKHILSPITVKDREAGVIVMVVPHKALVLHPPLYLRHSQGRLPLSIYMFTIASKINQGLPETVGFMHIWTRMIEDSLVTDFGQALRASVNIKVGVAPDNSLHMMIFGPAFYVPSISQTALNKIMHIEFKDPKYFYNTKDLITSHFSNYLLCTRTYAKDIQNYILHEKYCSTNHVVAALNSSTFEGFLDFVIEFRKSMYILAYLFGCVPYSHANIVSSTIQSLDYGALQPEDMLVQHTMKLGVGERCIRLKAKLLEDQTSTVSNLYQLGPMSPLNAVFTKFINFLTWEAFYFLRTKESLGYINRIYMDLSYGIVSMVVEVAGIQVDINSTDYVDEKIDHFLHSFYEDHVNKFDSFKKFMSTKSYELPIEDLYHAVNFTFKQCLLTYSPEFRKLSTHVIGHPSDLTNEKAPRSPNRGAKFMQRMQCPDLEHDGRIGCSSNAGHKSKNESNSVVYDIPANFCNNDGYLITNLENFKKSLEIYPNDEPVEGF